jgi:sigma-E factor negative regulatory protein RseC
MLTETGRVVALEEDGLWVETIRKSTCGSCSVRKGCGHGLLNRMADGKRGYIRVLPGDQSIDNIRIDDQVLISIPEEVILRGSFIAYILPLLGMLLGAVAAVNWLPGNTDLSALLGAMAGLGLGFLLVRWHGLRHRLDPAYQPVLQGAAGSPAGPSGEPAHLS